MRVRDAKGRYIPTPVGPRFWAKVDKNGPMPQTHAALGSEGGPCWIWTAARMREGYGRFDQVLAHRLAYELVIGKIPDGLQLDHLCRNRACVNPAHLEPVSCRENVLRGVGLSANNAHKTHCPAGHPLSGANLLSHSLKQGYRKCRACHAARQRAYLAEKRAA